MPCQPAEEGGLLLPPLAAEAPFAPVSLSREGVRTPKDGETVGSVWGAGVRQPGSLQPVPASPLNTPYSLWEKHQRITGRAAGKVVAALLLLGWISPESVAVGLDCACVCMGVVKRSSKKTMLYKTRAEFIMKIILAH